MKLRHLLLTAAAALAASAALHATANPIDTDHDGVFDEDDSCPTVHGSPCFDGCPSPVPGEECVVVRGSNNGNFVDVVCPDGSIMPHWVGCSSYATNWESYRLAHFNVDGELILTEKLPAAGPCGDGAADEACSCTAGETKYHRESDGMYVCVDPPPFRDVCTAYMKGHGFDEEDASSVCEYFVGNGSFPLPSWAIEQPWLWDVNMQIALSCTFAEEVDYVLGVGSFTVAGLKGIEAANLFRIGVKPLAFAALRFSGIASLVGFSGSTISEVCDWVGY